MLRYMLKESKNDHRCYIFYADVAAIVSMKYFQQSQFIQRSHHKTDHKFIIDISKRGDA